MGMTSYAMYPAAYLHCTLLIRSPDVLNVSVSIEVSSCWQHTVEELLYRQTVTSLDEVIPLSRDIYTHAQIPHITHQ